MAIAELLATDLVSVEHALGAGAHRIELCAALEVGGVTPGIGFLKAAVRLAEAAAPPGARRTGIVALVRPRRGDFVLDGARGLALLEAEIEAARDAGAAGVAVGVLTPSGEMDLAAMEVLVEAAGPMPVTCHRAVDHAREPLHAAAQLASLGVARILTSGAAASALEGAAAIRAMVFAVGPTIEVIAAGGVHGGTATKVLTATGAPAIHGSCSHQIETPHGGASASVQMGAAGSFPENVRFVLDPASAAAFVAAADRFDGPPRPVE